MTTGAMTKTKVAIYGLGYIGRMVFEAIQNENFFSNQRLEIVGAVDIVSESIAWAETKGVKAYQSFKELLAKERPDVCIHTTSSNLQTVLPQILEIVEAKVPVVSSSEELFYPWVRNAAVAETLNGACLKAGVAVIGTGVNPGFIMDVLPATMTQVCQTIEQIRVQRVVNASLRRPPLQRRIGVGLDEGSFRAQASSGRISSAGLMESLDFLAAFMGWKLSDVGSVFEPILAARAVQTATFAVKKDHVLGYRQKAWGELDRKRVIELDLKVYLEAERPGDHIVIKGTPPLDLWIEGGVPGDPGAVAALIRGVPRVLNARPGIVRRLERGAFTA